MARSSDPQFYMSNLFPTIDVKARLGETASKRIDIFNSDGAKFIDKLEPLSQISWASRNRLDLVAYKTSGTVSSWWTILCFNGDQHPFEIKNGKTVTVPNATVSSLVAVNRTKGRGSRVKI